MIIKEYDFKVKTYHCAPHGRLGLHSLMQQMQEAASLHAEELGVGEQWLIENNDMWVLVDLKVKIESLPSWMEDVTIYTWPSGYNAIKAYREFLAQGSSGEELFRASSSWMVLSKEKKMPAMMRDVLKNMPKGSRRNFPEMKRLKIPEKVYFIKDQTVPYHSIDSNGHVNNTEYVKWSVDGAHKAGVPVERIRSLQASFLAEVFEGDELEVLRTDPKENRTMIAMIRKKDGKNVFLMEIG